MAGGHAHGAEGPERAPRDVRIVEDMLRSMDVQQWEPRVVNQLLEFMYRYSSEVLTEAQVYAEYSNRPTVDLDDVKLAVRSICAKSFTSPPSREVLMGLAQSLRNPVHLKPIEGRQGMRLPPDEFTLTTPGWQIRLPARPGPEPPLAPPEGDGKGAKKRSRAKVAGGMLTGEVGSSKVSFGLTKPSAKP